MTSIGGFDSFGSAGALSLLNSMGSSSGVFGALSGAGTSTSPTISALGVSASSGNAAQSIQQLTRNQSIQTQRNNIYRIISDRINAVATGQLEPSADWEKLGGYYAATGKPFVISLDTKGQPVITPQEQMDASRYSVSQRTKLGQAVSSLLDLAPQVQANTDHDNLKNQWDSISVNLVDIKNNNLIPTTAWQQQASTIMMLNHPISFSLDSSGTVAVQDQTVSTFQDKDPQVRDALIKASRMAADAVSTDLSYNKYLAQGLTPPQALQEKQTKYSQYGWVQEASSYAALGIPFTLDADPNQRTTSVNYVTKTEKTTFSNGQPNAVNSFTINNSGTDSFGFPDTTTDAANPQPFASKNRINTTILGITDDSGNPISPINYTNPVNIVSSAENALTVTDTVTGTTDNYSFDSGTGSLTVSTTNKLGSDLGSVSYPATGLSAVAWQAPTISVVDGAGKSILAPGSGMPISYNKPVSINRTDPYNLTVTDTATGNVDTYTTTLDESNNPVQNAQGNYLLSLSHTDSLGRTIAPTQALGSSKPGLSTLEVPSANAVTVQADGSGVATSISRTTILPMDKYSAATGSNGNKLSSVITDGNGAALGTYTAPVSISNDGAGTIAVTNRQTGHIDTYKDNFDNTISISHTDAAGNVISDGATLENRSGLGVQVSETPTVKFADDSGNTILDSRGMAIPSYSGPVSIADTSTSPDKSYQVTDAATGYYETYAYTYDSNAGTGALAISHYDNQGNQLYTQTASDVAGFNLSTSPVTIGVTDASGAALTDTSGAAPPSYTSPVSFQDTGPGSFSITDKSTGFVDQYSYDSAAQTLSINHNDNANNTLSTQSFEGVAGLSKPWTSMAGTDAARWDVFNKTTLHSALTSATSFDTTYDTSTFDLTSPATHLDTPAAYTSSTTYSYTSNEVVNPNLMQSALPNLKLNYVVSPTITVTPVTSVEMPASLEPAAEPYDINTNKMESWKKDAVGYMKSGTPYMLDFDPQGHLVAKKLSGDNVIKFNNPQVGAGSYTTSATSSSGYSGVASLLSTLA
ncbi:MAG: hypothetical protein WCO00_10190 [Rhodospirillaceae bacterium]